MADSFISIDFGKVDWSKAPDWAMFHAMDKNGESYWYEFRPSDEFDESTDTEWASKGREKQAGDPYIENWFCTLERRNNAS